MNWVDIAILVIIAISVAISILRGFTREALSLAGWILAFWIALTFSSKAEELLTPHIETPSARMMVAFAILFFITLILAALVNYLAIQLIKKSGLSGTDRMIGIFFGLARGCAVIAVLVLLGGFTALPQDPWWRESMLLHYFQDMALWARPYLPAEIATAIKY
jgi:membrane protein required for colicin V production